MLEGDKCYAKKKKKSRTEKGILEYAEGQFSILNRMVMLDQRLDISERVSRTASWRGGHL